MNILNKGAIGAAVFGLASSAFAALPAAATTAITTLETDAGSMVDSGWPILVAVTGGLILMGVFKKVLSRAT